MKQAVWSSYYVKAQLWITAWKFGANRMLPSPIPAGLKHCWQQHHMLEGQPCSFLCSLVLNCSSRLHWGKKCCNS